MDYFIAFLEGIITFISPCLLPMLPIYISYFTGQNQDGSKVKTLSNALGFVIGFTVIFVLLGTLAGTVGGFFSKHRTAVNLVSGLLVILFGLNFMGVIKLSFFRLGIHLNMKNSPVGFFSSILFGMVFSVGWTPCVGAFLGSALMLAASHGESLKGFFMLLAFSCGLGIPFIASAILIDRLKKTFDFIKKQYRIINIVSGALLVVVGIFMATGLFGYILSLLTFS